MSDTQAPEIIWLDGDTEVGDCPGVRGPFEDRKYASEPAIAYIRKDISDARVVELEVELVGALAVIKDAVSYTHSGDPWEENTFDMEELDLHHYVRDGRYDKAIKVGKSND